MTSPASRQSRTGARLRAATRRRLLDAAAEEFAARGYAGATVTRIAARASVTVQTLYTVCGSKRQMLRALLTDALAGQADPGEHFAAAFVDASPPDTAAGVDHIADMFVGVARRAGVLWRVYQDAAAVDGEIAADWQDLQERRHETISRLVSMIGRSNDVPAPVPAPVAVPISVPVSVPMADTVWALASPETWDLLVRRRGYTPEEYREWLGRTLHAAVPNL